MDSVCTCVIVRECVRERERVNIFTLRESVHTVEIEGRMVSVDVMSVCVQLILSTSMEPVSLK